MNLSPKVLNSLFIIGIAIIGELAGKFLSAHNPGGISAVFPYGSFIMLLLSLPLGIITKWVAGDKLIPFNSPPHTIALVYATMWSVVIALLYATWVFMQTNQH